MSYKFRKFDYSQSGYEQIIDIHNAKWPEDKTDINEVRHRDQKRNPDHFWHRLVAEQDGRIVGYGEYCETWWSARPGKYYCRFLTHPAYRQQGIAAAFYDRIVNILSTRGEFNLLTAGTRENKPEAIRFLTDLGFVQVMREPVSHLHVATFDVDAYCGLEAKMQQRGIQICSLAELSQTDANWLRKLYELEWEIEQDVPSPEPPTKPPFDDYRKFVDSPNFLADAYFVAVAGEKYVGTSALWHSDVEKQKLYTGLTGVARSHRRQGIATAMKLRGIQYAQQHDVEIIQTENEESNPMYQINLRLGFVAQPAWLEFHKTMNS